MKKVIILRGVSGCGKSSFAALLNDLYDRGNDGKCCNHTDSCIVCTADDYFVNEKGEYKFDFSKLGAAHKQCFDKFKNAVSESMELVIVANTNTSEKEFNPYIELAKSYGYEITSLIVENRHGGKNIHNVPQETLDKQAKKIIGSIKLL